MNLIAISARKRCGKDTAAQFIINKLAGKSYMLADPIKRALAYALRSHGINVETVEGKIDFSRFYGFDDINGTTDVDREQVIQQIDSQDAETIFLSAWSWVRERMPKYNDPIYTGSAINAIRELVYNQEPGKVWSIRRLMQGFGTDIGVRVDTQIWMRFMMDVYLDAINDNICLVVTDCRQDHEMNVMRKLGATVIHIDRPGFSDVVSDTHQTEKGLTRHLGDVIINNSSTLEEFELKIDSILTWLNDL